MQTVWKGSISFGLVSIPVRLVSATEEKDVRFRQVHAADAGRIRYKRVCEAGGHEVAYADIAKGYELDTGEMVVLTDEDLDDLPVSSGRVVDVVAFVPFAQIDPTGLSRAYYVEPSSDAKPYVLLRDALEKTDRVALVKISLRNRERLAVVRTREGVLILQTMLWPDEIRQPAFDFLEDEPTVRPQEVQMAESFIEAMAADFEPDEYVDDYREALLKVVQAKIEGAEITKAPETEVEEGKVVDLMEALRQSVEEAKKQRANKKAS
jgi:DNA end-binding protein Ku